MTLPAAFRGTYSDWRLVKTRAVVQVIFEVPLADADAAYDVLGGMPDGSKERWFGIAAINLQPQEAPQSRQDDPKPSTPDGDRRTWSELQPSQQAGIRCAEPIFWAYLKERHGMVAFPNTENAATHVRKICAVNSRAHFTTNPTAKKRWQELDTQFHAWKLAEQLA